MKFDGMGLLGGFTDLRSGGRRSIAIFSPVGDEGQLRGFVSHVKKLGLDSIADFIFIMRPGLSPGKTGLSELRCFEAMQLGTSGCFFAGQALAYSLGYEVIVVADLDAFLDSRETFSMLLDIAQREKCAAVARSQSSAGAAGKGGYFVINQWGAIHRSVFGRIGFALPYMFKGGEDYEFTARLRKAGLLKVCEKGFVTHPRAGFTIYHKMAQPQKFYPYVSGLMKAQLFAGQRMKYLAWHVFYSFFADAFSEQELRRQVQSVRSMSIAGVAACEPKISISGQDAAGAAPGVAAYRMFFIPLSLASLLASGSARFQSCAIRLGIGRVPFFFGLLKATVLVPFRFAEAFSSMASWKACARGLVFPILPENAHAAAENYVSLLASREQQKR